MVWLLVEAFFHRVLAEQEGTVASGCEWGWGTSVCREEVASSGNGGNPRSWRNNKSTKQCSPPQNNHSSNGPYQLHLTVLKKKKKKKKTNNNNKQTVDVEIISASHCP